MSRFIRTSTWILGLTLLCVLVVSPAFARQQAGSTDQSTDTSTTKKKSKKSKKDTAAASDQSASTTDQSASGTTTKKSRKKTTAASSDQSATAGGSTTADTSRRGGKRGPGREYNRRFRYHDEEKPQEERRYHGRGASQQRHSCNQYNCEQRCEHHDYQEKQKEVDSCKRLANGSASAELGSRDSGVQQVDDGTEYPRKFFDFECSRDEFRAFKEDFDEGSCNGRRFRF